MSLSDKRVAALALFFSAYVVACLVCPDFCPALHFPDRLRKLLLLCTLTSFAALFSFLLTFAPKAPRVSTEPVDWDSPAVTS